MTETFKFQYVVDGNTKGFFSTKGSVEQNGLKLGDGLLPYSSVCDSTTRDSRLVLVLEPSDPDLPVKVREYLQGHHLVLEIAGNKAEKLERHIDRFSSRHEADLHKKELDAEGKGHLFKTVSCPCCDATVDLSELPNTPFVYCRFCETIFGDGLSKLKDLIRYRECDECGYHDRVQGYGEFYFYFLLVVYGFRHSRRHLCDACGASLANKLLAINFIFVLGVPNAIMCAVRARGGKDPAMAGLTEGNRLAKKGLMDKANPNYQKVLQVFKNHPGVHYNKALGNLTSERIEEGLQDLRTVVEACPTHLPALRLIANISRES